MQYINSKKRCKTQKNNQKIWVNKEYLRSHPDHIFIFADDTLHRTHRGTANLRDEPNTYGFITKIYPNDDYNSYYDAYAYKHIYRQEMEKLRKMIARNPEKTFIIPKLGSRFSNKFKIWERIIEPNIKEDLENFKNVIFLF